MTGRNDRRAPFPPPTRPAPAPQSAESRSVSARVALLGTEETKSEELGALEGMLAGRKLDVARVDLSLGSAGAVWSNGEKLRRMDETAARGAAALRELDARAAIAVGGGTGSEIALRAMRAMPLDAPRFLVTTLPFDPRAAVADSPVALIPSPCDFQGMNATLRRIFAQAAAMVAASVATPAAEREASGVAVSTLGVTQGAGGEVVRLLRQAGRETLAFHAAGFGGAALARFAREERLAGVVDLAVHEIVRMTVHGCHAPMPDRFTSASGLPRVALPGGINFLDCGASSLLTDAWRARPHCRHNRFATHVRLTVEEVEGAARALARDLNASTAPCIVLLPMGGFSSEDRPGGLLEGPEIRDRAAGVLEEEARAYDAVRLPHHINAPETAAEAVKRLLPLLPSEGADA